MKLIANTIIIASALTTMVTASLFTNTIILAVALATVATATPQQFTFAGFHGYGDNGPGGESCDTYIACYSVKDDTQKREREGYILGCIHNVSNPSQSSLADGVFALDFCHRQERDGVTYCAALLTEISSGKTLQSPLAFLEPKDNVMVGQHDAMAFYGHGPHPELSETSWKNPKCKGILSHP